LETARMVALLKSLDLALVPSKAKPGSMEALIDDLVNVDLRYGSFNIDDNDDPRLLKITLLGFDAVPALIDHLDDERLTRSVQMGMMNSPTSERRVNDVVIGLIGQLAWGGLDWDSRQGYAAEKAAASAWFEKARQQGEEAYLLAHIVSYDPNNPEPNVAAVRIIASRYPKNLPALYRTILEQRPFMADSWLAKAVGDSALPREEKLALFLETAKGDNLAQRASALWQLKDLDKQAFLKQLVQTVGDLTSPAGQFWNYPKGGFTELVMQTDDPAAWTALRQAAAKVNVGLRMQFLAPLEQAYIGQSQRRHGLALLSSFLDDDEARPSSDADQCCESYPGVSIPHLEVRDEAAIEIASVLKLPLDSEPSKDWSARQWVDLRKQARDAVTRELLTPTIQPASTKIFPASAGGVDR
jgi:hypothetical protein